MTSTNFHLNFILMHYEIYDDDDDHVALWKMRACVLVNINKNLYETFSSLSAEELKTCHKINFESRQNLKKNKNLKTARCQIIILFE